MMNTKRILGRVTLSLIIWVGISFLVGTNSYNYVSSDYGFRDFEFPKKGRNLESVEFRFEKYKLKCNDQEIVLFRTTRRNILLITEWSDYLTHRRWKYKYQEREK